MWIKISKNFETSFRKISKSCSHIIVTTGQGAFRITYWAVEPIRSLLTFDLLLTTTIISLIWLSLANCKRPSPGERPRIYFIVITGHGACKTTYWAVEPSRSLPTLDLLLTPIIISAIFSSSANQTKFSPVERELTKRRVL